MARISAQERRESVVRAAIAEFALKGYYGTSTEAIAKRVGVTQPGMAELGHPAPSRADRAANYGPDGMLFVGGPDEEGLRSAGARDSRRTGADPPGAARTPRRPTTDDSRRRSSSGRHSAARTGQSG